MKTIYMVSSGEYSDYSVLGLFSTQEAAEACADRYVYFGGDGADVEEWELDVLVERQPGCYTCYLDTEGVVTKQAKSSYYKPTESAFHYTHINNEGFVGYGATPEHAKRSALDLWREWKAFNAAKVDA